VNGPIQNTLYVTEEGCRLGKEGETLVVSQKGKQLLQLPYRYLASVVCLGRSRLTPELMAALAEIGVSVAYLSPNGKFLARVEGLPGGSLCLRRAQFRASESRDARVELARSMVIGKLTNQRALLQRAKRETTDEVVKRDRRVSTLTSLRQNVSRAPDLDTIRGEEGASAQQFFGAWRHLIKTTDGTFTWTKRTRRPPRDPVNALLSFGYVLLMVDCTGALASVGLDPALGFLHADRPGRLSLSLDLMEELRTPVVDRLVLKLVNRRELRESDFQSVGAGEMRLTDAGRKAFLRAYQKSKQTQVRHGFLQRDVDWRQVAHLQARLLARTLRGDLDAYPPFVVR
jgi:CRISPR-associated protein Cas1